MGQQLNGYPDPQLNLNYATNEAVYFYSGPFDPLNNWSAHEVNVWGQIFKTVEHGYHWRKFADAHPDMAALVLAAPSPWAAMKVERQYREFRPADWHGEHKVKVMRELLRAKYDGNEDVRLMLVATGTKQIIENSPSDSFWGAGPDGRGQNMIGQLWMELRDSIKA